MIPLLLLQGLTNRFFLSMHGYLLEKKIFSWIYKNYKRILSSASQLTFSRTCFSLEHLLHQQMFQLSTYSSSGIPLHRMQRLGYTTSNWMNSGLLLMLIFFVRLWRLPLHKIHRRLVSPVYVTGDDFLLGNLKFVPKGEKDEVFVKPVPQELITEAIQNSEYYEKYLEMAARKPIAKVGAKKKKASKADKPTKPAPAK
ncbi:hypothetical protein Tco_1342144 [Tanacetum coccineum]